MFFKKNKPKSCVFKPDFVTNFKMILTIIFGILGLILIGYWKWALAIIVIAVSYFCFCSFKNITIKGYSIQKLLYKINEIPKKIHRKNIFGSLSLLGFFASILCFVLVLMSIYLI